MIETKMKKDKIVKNEIFKYGWFNIEIEENTYYGKIIGYYCLIYIENKLIYNSLWSKPSEEIQKSKEKTKEFVKSEIDNPNNRWLSFHRPNKNE